MLRGLDKNSRQEAYLPTIMFRISPFQTGIQVSGKQTVFQFLGTEAKKHSREKSLRVSSTFAPRPISKLSAPSTISRGDSLYHILLHTPVSVYNEDRTMPDLYVSTKEEKLVTDHTPTKNPLAAFAHFPKNTHFETAAIVLWYLFTLAVFLEGILTWFFNVNIITNKRIMDVDFYTLIYREISDAQIANIQETTYKVGGFLGTIFNFGNVQIQTAGALPNFVFENVPNPTEVVRILQQLQKGGSGNL